MFGYALQMRLRLLTIFCAALTSLVTAQDAPRPIQNSSDSQTFLDAQLHPLPPLSAARARRVRSLVAQMTLKEKVGQMTQLEVGMITDGSESNLRVNPEKLRKAVNDYGVIVPQARGAQTPSWERVDRPESSSRP